jgi:hypothetical protein
MTEEQWVILKADIDDVNKKLDSLLNKTNQTATSMQTSFVRMAKQVAGALGIAFSVSTIVNFGKQSVEEFKNAQLSALELTNVLKNVGVPEAGIKSIQDMVSRLSELSKFKPEEINSVLIDLTRRLGDAALAVKALPVVIEGARNGIGDLSTTTNELVLGLQNAAAGISTTGRGLKDFGVTVTKGKSAIDILDEALTHVKGSADTFNNSLAGTEAVGALAINTLKEDIGSKLAPAIEGINLGLETQIGLWTANRVAGTSGMASIRDVTYTLTNIVGALGATTVELLKTWYELVKHPTLFGLDFKSLSEEWKEVGKEWKTVFTLPPENPVANVSDELKKAQNATTQFLAGLGLVPGKFNDATNSADKLTDSVNKFKSAWASINIQGLNLPELTKFVGNLNMAVAIPKTPTPAPASMPAQTLKVNVELHGNLSLKEQMVQGGREIGNVIVNGIKQGLNEGLSTVSHGTRWYAIE